MKMRDSGDSPRGGEMLNKVKQRGRAVQRSPRISLPRFAGEVPPNGGGGGSSCYLFNLRSIIKF